MLFNSIDFLIFFPLVVLVYYLIPHKFRWALLLGTSYYFYASANGKLLFLLIFSTLIDYFAGLRMGQLESKKERKPYLILSLIINLGVLGLFKYYNFFFDSFSTLFLSLNIEYAIPALNLILPVGISFYTLQTLAYSIDVYKGKLKAEKHIGHFALYVCYFPQLVAGPIERASNLLPEFKEKKELDFDRISKGLKLMGFGLFKKVVIADQIAPMIQYFTNDPSSFNGLSVLICSCLFAYQIYCDFSGYSDIAIGAAQVMGVKLMVNFRRPFAAKSLSELWSRWHISLIQWFRDYIFNELGGKKSGMNRIYLNSLIVFIISGLWHGAAWSFIIWGTLNGLIVIFYRISNIKKISIRFFGKFRNNTFYQTFLKVKTFLLFAVIAPFFYENDLETIFTIFNNFRSGWIEDFKNIIINENDSRGHILYLGHSVGEFLFLIGSLLTLEIIQFYQERNGSVRELLSTKPIYVRWSLYICLVFSIILFSFDRDIPFIYFQF
jgi:D-alanyl-lipoteichoic acid acyltransferase DltB (MBOAT superfamily)